MFAEFYLIKVAAESEVVSVPPASIEPLEGNPEAVDDCNCLL